MAKESTGSAPSSSVVWGSWRILPAGRCRRSSQRMFEVLVGLLGCEESERREPRVRASVSERIWEPA